MKFLLPFLWLFICQISPAQDTDNTTKVELEDVSYATPIMTSTPSGYSINNAINGKRLVYISAGNLTGNLSPFESYFRRYLYTTYGIASIAYGCMIVGPEFELMNSMNARIKAEHGADFIHDERNRAKELFEKTK